MGIISVKVRTDGIAALKQALSASKSPAEHVLAVQVAKDTEPFVPFRTGVLRNTTQVRGNMIAYTQPYSHFLYEGKVFIYPPTGSTWAPKGERKQRTERDLHIWEGQSHWLEASKAQNLEKWEKVAAEAIKREL